MKDVERDIVELVRDPAEGEDELIAVRQGPIQWVVFNRPRARNAMTWHMYERLVEVCKGVNEDRTVRAMVLTGAGGRAFVAGTDISQFRSFSTEKDALDYEARGNNVMRTLETVRVPTIAAIAGPCTGGGAGIAASCDLRLASPAARYGFPIARTLGNCLSMQNYARLFTLLGPARTKDILLTARLMDAQEMLACGLVREVVADEHTLLPRAQELAEELATHAPLTMWASKEALRRIKERLIPDGADSDLILACYMSQDFKEGVEAFLAKRKPQWRGE
ncbi:MAG TPA: enoyl-CoA hydratase/isomerase family protein [Candidatus Dormibacteraeota bacterium]|nr:enoyl-CoA hydratase/isomerase family protein [Candidatus Dormibacteraeota bacterium]